MGMIFVYYTKSKTELTQMFSHEICKIFKNTYFQEHLLTAVSEKKMITWLIKQSNTGQANSWGIKNLLDNFNFTIVNPEYDIACVIQPIRFLAQDHPRSFFVHHMETMLPY